MPDSPRRRDRDAADATNVASASNNDRKDEKEARGGESYRIIAGREGREGSVWRSLFGRREKETGSGGTSGERTGEERRCKKQDETRGTETTAGARFKRRRSIKSLIKGLAVTRFRLRDNNVHYGGSDA